MATTATEPEVFELDGRLLIRKTARTLRKKAEWRDAIVRAKVPIRKHGATLPPGSYYQVSRNYLGLRLRSLPRRCCGFRMDVGKVAETDVDYVGHIQLDGDFMAAYRTQEIVDKWRINAAEPAWSKE